MPIDTAPPANPNEMTIVISKGNEQNPPPSTPTDAGQDYTLPDSASGDYVFPPLTDELVNQFSSQQLSTYSAVSAAAKGEDPVQVYEASKSQTPEQLVIAARQKYNEDTNAGLASVLSADARTLQPDDLAKSVDDVGNYARQAEANAQSATVPERAMVEDVSRLMSDTADETEKKIIAQQYFKRRMGQILFSQGIGDWVANVGGLLTMSDESLETGMTATGAKWYDPQIVTSWFNSADNWNKFVSAFASLTAEEQVKDFEAIASVMKDTHDNNAIKIMDHLSQLVDPSSVNSTLFWHTTDKLFLAGTVAHFAQAASKVLRSANLLDTMKKLDNATLAAKTASAAAKDSKVADAVGVTREAAAAEHVPFDNSVLLDGADGHLADEVLAQQQTLDKYLELNNDVGRGFLSQLDAEKALNNTIEDLKKTKNVSDVQVIKSDNLGATITYKVTTRSRRGKEKTPVKLVKEKTLTRNYTVDDITGELVPEDLGILKSTTSGFWSPNFLFNRNRAQLVNEPERILREQESMSLKFSRAIKEVYKGLDRASTQRVNAVLARGRDEEVVYSYNQLVGGGVLNKQEFNAYANTRHLFDIAHAAENTLTRNKAVAKGLKEIKIGSSTEIVRPAEDIQAAKSMASAATDKMVYIPDPKTGTPKYIKLDDALLESHYNDKYVLVRKDGGQYFGAGEGRFADLALIKRSEINELPPTMVSFRPGYAPVDYKNGIYFVKTAIRGEVGGAQKVVGLKTHRYFDSLRDAEEFANDLRVNGYVDASRGEHVTPAAEDVKVMHNRQMAQEAFDEDRIRIFGGMYNSARAGERIKFGLDGANPELVDPLIALSHYFDNLSRNYPMHLYRLGLEQTWMNTARSRWGLARDYRGTFQDAIKHIADSMSITERKEAQKSHAQIALQMRIPTTEERAIRTWTRDFAERVELGKGAPGLRKRTAQVMHRLDSRDPVNAVLSAGFHAVMGVWNFSTMVVQGLGATVAMSIHPLRAPKHLAETLALTSLDNILDPHALSLANKRIGSALAQKMSAGEWLGDLHKSWTMSGLRESILSGNPEYAALAKGLPYDRTLLQKALNTHTIFYKTGESFNYRYAWTAAFDWWKQKPGNRTRAITQDAVNEIRARADTYILHMSKANRATMQTGALRIPSQFTNVFFKYAEAVMGKELTTAEKTRMLVGQGILFGYAGAPVISGVADWAMGKVDTKLDENQKDAVRNGLLQHLVHTYLGINVDVASRASVMQGMYQEITDLLIRGESIGEVAAGATGSILGKRGAETLTRIFNLGKTAASVPASEDIPPEIWSAAVDATLDLTSSWRSLSAAREVSTNKLFKDRRGNILFRLENGEMNVQTKIATALGFQYSDLNKIYLASMNQLDDHRRMQEKSEAIIKTIDDILVRSNTTQQDPKQAQVINLVFNALMENETPENQMKIRDNALRRILDPTTTQDRLRRGQIQDLIYDGMLSGGPVAPNLLEDR